MNTPLVTVLMPVYNGEKYLKEAIDSILFQTYKDFELMIINDGSTDQTESIILSYSDSRVHYIKNEKNSGIIYTLNKGLDLVKTTFVARMDADDVCLPNRIEEQLNFMNLHPEVGLLGSWVETIEKQRKRIIQYIDDFDFIRFKLLFNSYLHHPTVMMRMSVLNENKLRYPQMLHVEDYALWINLAKYTQIRILPKVLLKYRIHEDSICQKYDNFQQEQVQILRKQQITDFNFKFTDRQYCVYTHFIDEQKIDNVKDFEDLMIFLENLLLATKDYKFSQYLFEYLEREIHQFVEQYATRMKGILKSFSKSIFATSYKQIVRLYFKKLWTRI